MINLEFLLASLFIILLPGSGVLFTVSTGLVAGWRASLLAALGSTIGIAPHVLASILGLSALLHSSAVLFQAFKFLGVAYLLYLAWSTWREAGALAFENKSSGEGGLKVASKAFLICTLNPKITVFFLAYLPQFISQPDTQATASMITLGGVYMAMTLVVFSGYGLLADRIRRLIEGAPKKLKHLQRGFAGVFALFASKLALAER